MELKGGVALSQRNLSFLRFSLEESVWFQRGQEVEELVSISLDPKITIQENNQYVTIRGSLALTGEYNCQSETVLVDNQSNTTQKWVHVVERRQDGICEFSHEFPVEINIPSYRVRDLSEIDVMIETFDYLLPERSCLKLTAELNISGLYEEEHEVVENQVAFELSHRNQQVEEEGYTEDVELSDETEDEADYKVFEAEARKDQTVFTEPTFAESSSYQTASPEISFAAYRQEESSPQVAEMNEFQLKDEAENNTPDESSESSSSSSLVGKIKKKLTYKQSMSISEFLARKEGDDHVKLKVCIVQNGESVETLAERYDVTVQQLLKVNHLELNQDVYEGQVLYVPQIASRK
jgi:stage VI sporulation protein D